MNERVGFIGLGAMGTAMCGRLLAAGYSVRVYARTARQADALVAAGAIAADSAADLARDCSVVCLNVTSSPDVLEVLFGSNGVVHGLASGSVVLDFSTIAAKAARDAGTRLAALGVAFLDCPVSGGEAGAREGSLSIMVGGAAASLARVRPILECLGHRITHIGASGAGQVAKACNQLVQVVAIEAIAEAFRYASAEGVEPAPVLEALSGGYAASRMLDLMGPRMAARNFEAGIPARLHCKDIGLVVAAARELGLALPVAHALNGQLEMLSREGLGDCDTSVLLRVLEASAP